MWQNVWQDVSALHCTALNLVGMQCLMATSSFSVGRKLKQWNAAERRGALLQQQPISRTGQAASSSSSSVKQQISRKSLISYPLLNFTFVSGIDTKLKSRVLALRGWLRWLLQIKYCKYRVLALRGGYCKASLSLSECHSPGTHRPTPDQSSSLFTAHNVESKNEDLHPLPPWLSEFYVHELD